MHRSPSFAIGSAFAFYAGFVAVAFPALAFSKPHYVTIDVHGGESEVTDINSSGEVIGIADHQNPSGFLREPDGTIIDLVIPGYSDAWPSAINKYGYIAGSADNFHVGFVRASDGTVTIFSVPSDENGMHTLDINANGQIVGFSTDSSDLGWGFLREPDGSVTSFALADPGWTYPASINDAGVIAGTYDFDGVVHGFVRKSSGRTTTFDMPNYDDFFVTGIRNDGWIVGWGSPGSQPYFGFLRSPDGVITKFDIGGYTRAYCLNKAGTTAGGGFDATGHRVGFLRSMNGDIVTFKPPKTRGLDFACVNDHGVVAGTEFKRIDRRLLTYGFVRYP